MDTRNRSWFGLDENEAMFVVVSLRVSIGKRRPDHVHMGKNGYPGRREPCVVSTGQDMIVGPGVRAGLYFLIQDLPREPRAKIQFWMLECYSMRGEMIFRVCTCREHAR
jgi:hypothetical protein